MSDLGALLMFLTVLLVYWTYLILSVFDYIVTAFHCSYRPLCALISTQNSHLTLHLFMHIDSANYAAFSVCEGRTCTSKLS